MIKKLALIIASAMALASPALAANMTATAIAAPVYAPTSVSASMNAGAGGDTLCYYVPGGFTALRIWSPATTLTFGLRMWRITGVSGSTESYEVLPKSANAIPAANYRYVVIDSDGAANVTGGGWQEYSGISADYFSVYNGTGTTTIFTVEVRR